MLHNMQLNEEIIGKFIFLARRDAGLTQAELGALIGESKWLVHRIEVGAKRPSTAEVAAIAEALGDAALLVQCCGQCAVGKARWEKSAAL